MRRRKTITEIVGRDSVQSQEDLMILLVKRGFAVTQPTLSRDLRELGLVKTPGGYVAPSALETTAAFISPNLQEQRLDRLLAGTVIAAESAGNLVILKTPPAQAQPVASLLDSTPVEGLLGTIAGDDTVFAAFRTVRTAGAFARHVRNTANLGGPRRRR